VSLMRLLSTLKGYLKSASRHRAGYLFVAPVMLVFTFFIIIPTVWTIYASVTDIRVNQTPRFIGMANYWAMWSDSVFLLAFRHTLVFSFCITALSVAAGLGVALLVNGARGTLNYISRTSIFLPATASLIVTAFIWRSFLEPQGLVQSALSGIGLRTTPWLASPALSFLAVILMSTWQRVGYNMVFFLAGLQSIPETLYEAAEVDGAAGGWPKLRFVTLPLLRHVTLFVLVMNTVYTFLMFEQVYALTGGGPAQSTLTLMIDIYSQAFRRMRYGYASAMAVVFSALAFTISMVQLRLLRRTPEY
jgi:multiple sugar transport system permease protein